jgi:hypothetical protein
MRSAFAHDPGVNGGTHVLARRVDAEQPVELIERERVTGPLMKLSEDRSAVQL